MQSPSLTYDNVSTSFAGRMFLESMPNHLNDVIFFADTVTAQSRPASNLPHKLQRAHEIMMFRTVPWTKCCTSHTGRLELLMIGPLHCWF
jgi:hypothetical protein